MNAGTADLASVSNTSIQAYTNYRNRQPDLRIFHYNDIYHVEAGSREPVGGVARFQTMHNFYANDKRFVGQPELLTFFSGDSLNPSLESTISKGKHMIPVMNNLGTNAACLGNHDLDFGVGQFVRLSQQCNFPWLCSNVLDPDLGDGVPLGGCQKTAMCLASSSGLKIGLLGLVEQEWLDTIDHLPPNLIFRQPSVVAKELARQLRAQGADIIIALAHQRMYNDRQLAEQLRPGTIDIILGGHDHTYEYAVVNNIPVLRSGSDFKQFSYIEAFRDECKWNFSIVRHDVHSCIAQDQAASRMISSITEALSSTLQKVIGFTSVPLDARTATVRKTESNLGNFICDVLRLRYGTDCSMVCGGTIRSDDVYPPGFLRVKDIVNCLPFEDTCVVLRLSGSTILEALENGVSQWPSEDGRFPQVSGISFSFDPALPAYARCCDVHIGGILIDLDRKYDMATRDYMSNGKDGYHMLRSVKLGGKTSIVQSAEHGIMLATLVRQFLASLRVVHCWQSFDELMEEQWARHETHLQKVRPTAPFISQQSNSGSQEKAAARSRVPEGIQYDLSKLSEVESDTEISKVDTNTVQHDERQRKLSRKFAQRWKKLAGLEPHSPLIAGKPGRQWHGGATIAPKLDGRIRILSLTR